MLARRLIISRRFSQVITAPKHRPTHISNYQSSEHKSNQHDESDMVKFPCTLKNVLLIIRDRFGLSFAKKGLGYLAALYLPLPLLVCYKLLPNKAPYRVNPEETKEIQRKVQQLIDNGHVRESLSTCAVPVILVPKKDGSFHMCSD